MHDKYYGDKRDLVKWSVLWLLANEERNGVKHILQIPFSHEDKKWPGEININDHSHPIPAQVRAQFCNMQLIKNLACPKDVRIDVFVSEVEWSGRARGAYIGEALEFIAAHDDGPRIIFLDPDTGLAENGKGDLHHVRVAEVKKFWEQMADGDLLVVYQHRFRQGEWSDLRREPLEEALQSQVFVAKGPDIAHDVAFFYARKGAKMANYQK